MARFLYIALSVFFLAGSLSAQVETGIPRQLDRDIRKIRELATQMEWDDARKMANKMVKRFPDWPQSWLVQAEVARELNLTEECEASMLTVIGLDSSHFPEAYRWIAERKFKTGQYKEASAFFERYHNLIPGNRLRSWKDSLLLASIRFAGDQLKQGSPCQPEKLSSLINTPDNEYFPSLTVDGSMLVFTRQVLHQPDTVRLKNQEDLYLADWDSGAFRNIRKMAFPINTPGNEGTQSISQDGRLMFFTACSRPDTKGGCDLYYAWRAGTEWGIPVNLGYPVNTRYWESTPFLAHDSRYLYFASNRPGGKGGMDIWRTKKHSSGSWEEPVNLGIPVNTPGNEMSPVVGSDGRTLYFASDGYPGMGNFDLFQSRIGPQGVLSEPQNLGFPINTFGNEDGLSLVAYRNTAYIASDRDPETGRDIYSVPWIIGTVKSKHEILTGMVLDKRSQRPVSAIIRIQCHADSVISSVESDPVTGRYLAGIPPGESFRIGATAEGYLPYSGLIRPPDDNAAPLIEVNIEMDPLNPGESVILRNIFFEWDSFTLLPESLPDLEEVFTLVDQNPAMRFEIGGHTDSTGGVEYNLELSRKRAESVRNYLVNRGIAAERIMSKGYGSGSPIADNSTESGRAQNRRTELKVLAL
jgi:outer membrane protein OmpA-like peptidoglycan-associated protein